MNENSMLDAVSHLVPVDERPPAMCYYCGQNEATGYAGEDIPICQSCDDRANQR
jgi:hypothetical protein